MPWLSDEPPQDTPGRTWHIALKNALLRRLQADEVEDVFDELGRKHRIEGLAAAEILMGFRAPGKATDDPLLFAYAGVLLRSRCCTPWDLLEALLRTSKFMRPTDSDTNSKKQRRMPTCEERMFTLVTQLFMAGQLHIHLTDAHSMVRIVAHWLHVIPQYETVRQLEAGDVHTIDVYSYGMYEALASLALTTLSNPALRKVVRLRWWQKRRPTIVTAIANFDSQVLMWIGSQLAGRLQALAGMPPFMECDKQGRPIFSDQQILASIPDLPVQTTRAGLYIWLNACLTARPRTNDMSILAYLQARYSGDNQSSAVALLQASFDVLTNALLRKDTEHDLFLIRSFICNKVPLLLSNLGSFMMAPATIEACIQAAFESITMDAVPPITAGSAEGRDRLTLTRKDFLQAATLQGLLSEQGMSAILMESTTSPPRVTRYTKENLYAQCSNNLGRVEQLVAELDGMVGNAGAIAGCVVAVVNNLCINKDTMSLKVVCNILIKHTAAMDVVMQYSQPSDLLAPICTRLNEWTHDQDGVEFTPAYEEFAAMLLFLLTMVHRYGLDVAELGPGNETDFVVEILHQIAKARKASDFSSEQSTQLSKWVEGLYAVDDSGDTNGISDEVMRHCPPQEFYRMVPTLFEQSVLACKSNALSLKLFKGGIELLLEPFLLPCLVGGLLWVANHSWEDHGDADVLLQALDKLLRQNSASQDAKSMHNAILGIVADALGHTLEVLISRKPNQRTEKQVTGLLDIIKPHRGQKRTMQSSRTELAAWAAATGGGFVDRLRSSIREQITWSSNIGPTPPAEYTHRLIASSLTTLGADATLDVLLSELKNQTGIGNGPLALDVCSALICAPGPHMELTFSALDRQSRHVSTQIALRDVLRLRLSSAQSLLKMPSSTAQALVRLSRVVEAQLAVAPMAQFPMTSMPLQAEAADKVMADLALSEGDLAVNNNGMTMDTSIPLDASADAAFSNAEIEAALMQQPAVGLEDTQQANVPALETQTSGMQGQGDDIFAEYMQSAQDPNGSNGGAEEDIFAGLGTSMDMEDFDFT